MLTFYKLASHTHTHTHTHTHVEKANITFKTIHYRKFWNQKLFKRLEKGSPDYIKVTGILLQSCPHYVIKYGVHRGTVASSTFQSAPAKKLGWEMMVRRHV